jgi:transcriptional regulator with GAF, ATPase, and Fis domain
MSKVESQLRVADLSRLATRNGCQTFYGLLYASDKMHRIVSQVKSIAPLNEVVLVLGGTGTGKELIARAIHHESNRAGGPFVPFNCSTISRELVESRLFGHHKGAFTGALHNQKGVIPGAQEGTLFLDEIGDLSPEAQGSLLRFLQFGEVQPVGASRPVKVDVRVVAATNRDLKGEIQTGRFREDLYYRLSVITIYLPPLRERPEDLLALAEHFASLYSKQYGMPGLLTTDAERDWLERYDWPGNVRELESYIKRRVLFGQEAFQLESRVSGPDGGKGHNGAGPSQAQTRWQVDTTPAWRKLSETEKQRLLADALNSTSGNITAAARQLGISRRTIQKLRRRASY